MWVDTCLVNIATPRYLSRILPPSLFDSSSRFQNQDSTPISPGLLMVSKERQKYRINNSLPLLRGNNSLVIIQVRGNNSLPKLLRSENIVFLLLPLTLKHTWARKAWSDPLPLHPKDRKIVYYKCNKKFLILSHCSCMFLDFYHVLFPKFLPDERTRVTFLVTINR